MTEPQLVFTKHILTDNWKRQITEAFTACRTNQDASNLYKRIFRFYYVRKFRGGRGYSDPDYKVCNQVTDYLAEALRRRCSALIGRKEDAV